eukprot:4792325-Prymnesium_polylepis.1
MLLAALLCQLALVSCVSCAHTAPRSNGAPLARSETTGRGAVFRLRGGVGLLGESAELFDACLLASDDVSVVAFVRACHHFISVLALFGKYAKVLIGATEENLRIVEGATGDDS